MTATAHATAKPEISHSEQQALAQAESIAEMVRALDRETAAEDYARDLSRERCIEILTDCGIECRDSETLEELREAVSVNVGDDTTTPDDFEFDEDEARERIQEDPLSVEVRSGWRSPGDVEGAKPEQFRILLCTGGPAVRIVGELDGNLQPDRAWIEHQDWGTPWTRLFNGIEQDTLLTYCQQFYFGE